MIHNKLLKLNICEETIINKLNNNIVKYDVYDNKSSYKYNSCYYHDTTESNNMYTISSYCSVITKCAIIVYHTDIEYVDKIIVIIKNINVFEIIININNIKSIFKNFYIIECDFTSNIKYKTDFLSGIPLFLYYYNLVCVKICVNEKYIYNNNLFRVYTGGFILTCNFNNRKTSEITNDIKYCDYNYITSNKFNNYWNHSAFQQFDNVKMSKNIISLKTILSSNVSCLIIKCASANQLNMLNTIYINVDKYTIYDSNPYLMYHDGYFFYEFNVQYKNNEPLIITIASACNIDNFDDVALFYSFY